MVIGKVTCKLCGQVFSRTDWILNRGKCNNSDCIVNNQEKQMASRAEKRRAKTEAQKAIQEARRLDKLSTSIVATTFVETEHEPDKMQEDGDNMMYFEFPAIVERHIKTRRHFM